MSERYVVLGLGPARSEWFRRIGRWAHDGSLAVQFVKCVSAADLLAHIRSARTFSAALLDAAAPGVDRDLIDAAGESGIAVFVVDDTRRADWQQLGAAAVLSSALSRDELSEALSRLARPIGDHDTIPGEVPAVPVAAAARADVTVVCGPGGTGASTVAMALAQAAGDDPGLGGMVLLVDAARRAELAMLHDAGDVVPGIQEAVELHRVGRPRLEDVRAHTFAIAARRYDLLLGLRRPHHWAALRPRAVEALFDSLIRGWRAVIVDTDGDAESTELSGSDDVEHRTLLMRTATSVARRVVVVGRPSTKGLHSLAALLHELVECGVDPALLVPVINDAPRAPQQRAELGKALVRLGPDAALAVAGPVFLPHQRRLEAVTRGGGRLPRPLVDALAGIRRVGRSRAATDVDADMGGPRRIVPGSLGLAEDTA